MSDKPDDTIERIARVLCLHPDPDTMVPGMVVTKMDGGFAAAFNGPLEPAWHSHRDVAQKVVAAMSVWRPIETAPKDGTWVLVFAPDCDAFPERTQAVAMWSDGWWFGTDLASSMCGATHWLPLPSPPSGSVVSQARGDK